MIVLFILIWIYWAFIRKYWSCRNGKQLLIMTRKLTLFLISREIISSKVEIIKIELNGILAIDEFRDDCPLDILLVWLDHDALHELICKCIFLRLIEVVLLAT